MRFTSVKAMICKWGIYKKLLSCLLKTAEMHAATVLHLLDLGQSLQQNLFLWARRLEREGKITDG